MVLCRELSRSHPFCPRHYYGMGEMDEIVRGAENPSTPLFDFIARVPLLDLVPEEGAADGGGDGATSMDGIVSEGSAGKCESMRGARRN